MNVSIIALDERGKEIVKPIIDKYSADIYIVKKSHTSIGEIYRNIKDRSQIVIFITNIGIAVRTIAPYLKTKWKDPGVLAIDTKGKYVIPLIGGHWGDANRFAEEISILIGGEPIITTRSELLGITPFDRIARENGLIIENPDTVKYITRNFEEKKMARVLSDLPCLHIPENVIISSPLEMKNSGWGVIISEYKRNLFSRDRYLFLRPKTISIGIGYRKNEDSERIKDAILYALELFDLSPLSIHTISTIYHKKGDKISEKIGAFFKREIRFLKREELSWIDKIYKGSVWVKKQIGVGSVSLPVMIKGQQGVKILLESENIYGVMISMGRIRKVINFGR